MDGDDALDDFLNGTAFIPGYGEIADAGHAVYRLSKRDWLGAGAYALGAIPLLHEGGDAIKAGRIFKALSRYVNVRRDEGEMVGLARLAEHLGLEGQVHHLISSAAARATEGHPTLGRIGEFRGHIRFLAIAADKAAHYGRQSWHRELDQQAAKWIRGTNGPTPNGYLRYVQSMYNTPEMKRRFPLLILPRAFRDLEGK